MNNSINDNSKTHDPQFFKVFLRIFIERMRKNRDDVPDMYMSELLRSSTKSLEEKATPREGRNTSLNHPSTPKEVNVNLKITLDIPESETEVKTEDMENDSSDSPSDEEKDITPSSDEDTNVAHDSSKAREETIKKSTDVDIKNPECTEKLAAFQVQSLPERSETLKEEELDELTDNIVHQDSLEEIKKSEAYSFRAVVPPGWYSTLKSSTPVSYGWKVASLVRLFENIPQEGGALQQVKTDVKNLPINRPDDDQHSPVKTDPIRAVVLEPKEEPTTSADEHDSVASLRESTSTTSGQGDHETSASSAGETSTSQQKVSANRRKRRWNKLQRPEHGVTDIPCLAVLNYQKALRANVSPHTDALVVQRLVMHEYKDDLSRLKQRKIRRESVRKSLTFQSCSEEDSFPEYSEIEENFLYGPCDVSEGGYKKFLGEAGSDSGLSHSDVAESSRISVKSGEASNATSGYEHQIDLKEVAVEKARSTGDISGNKSDQEDKEGSYYTTPERSCISLVPDQASIGSSNISALLSSCPARRSEMSFLSASSRTRNPLLFPTITNVGYYDSVPNKENELMRERNIQLEITHQISKAVLICRRQRKVVRQDIQVEAEKILLVATRRRDLIDEELKMCSNTPKETPPISVSVSMKNFNFSRAILMSGNKYCNRYSWFFVLVLEAGAAVLASEVVKGDSEILFKDCFRFEGKSEDFPINVKLFALVLKNHKKKWNSRQMISGPIPSPDYAPTHSFFNLWGSCQLRPSLLSKQGKNCFPLTQIPPEASLSNTFSADTEMHLKIMVFKRGFLTVGVDDPHRLPVWNRRWCVLDGAKLNYWNYPNEEEVSEPVGRLDLLKARCHKVQLVNKELCPWPKCLSLRIERSESAVREYFFSADTSEEFNEWQDRLNLVLGYLGKWKSSQERAECEE